MKNNETIDAIIPAQPGWWLIETYSSDTPTADGQYQTVERMAIIGWRESEFEDEHFMAPVVVGFRPPLCEGIEYPEMVTLPSGDRVRNYTYVIESPDGQRADAKGQAYLNWHFSTPEK